LTKKEGGVFKKLSVMPITEHFYLRFAQIKVTEENEYLKKRIYEKEKNYSSPRMREKPIIKPTITKSATSTNRIISSALRNLPAETGATSVDVWFIADWTTTTGAGSGVHASFSSTVSLVSPETLSWPSLNHESILTS